VKFDRDEFEISFRKKYYFTIDVRDTISRRDHSFNKCQNNFTVTTSVKCKILLYEEYRTCRINVLNSVYEDGVANKIASVGGSWCETFYQKCR